jgi:hypothetical protein
MTVDRDKTLLDIAFITSRDKKESTSAILLFNKSKRPQA